MVLEITMQLWEETHFFMTRERGLSLRWGVIQYVRTCTRNGEVV